MSGIILFVVLLVAASVVWSFEAAKMRADLRDKQLRIRNGQGGPEDDSNSFS